MLPYTKIRKILEIDNFNGNAEEIAFVTHYFHNHLNGISQIYKPRASLYFNKIDSPFLDIHLNKIDKLLPIKWDIPFPPPVNPNFTFIDLFAGIGGFRIPLQKLGGKCVFSSEFNLNAQKTYEANFGEIPFGDITKLDLKIVPNHDILCAGFPCQPFSISGKMKGFEDARGTLIYQVLKIINLRKPKVVFLENVKHLLYHDNGKTLASIEKDLRELGYIVKIKLLNAKDFGVAQNRERVIIIANRKKEFNFDKVKKIKPKLIKEILDKDGVFEYLNEPYTILKKTTTQESGLIFVGHRNKLIRKAGVRPGTEHLSRVHKQPNRIYSSEGVHPALPSQEVSGRFWIYHENKVRKLTINECYKLMGFPAKFKSVSNRGDLYKQIGNSVCIPMIKQVAIQIKEQLL
ncbi:MAG TPA: DNA cytosine methyltransferase [Puia sp.]